MVLLSRLTKKFVLGGIAFVGGNSAFAEPPLSAVTGPASVEVSNLHRLGESSFYVTFFHVYDAELWAPKTGFVWEQPFRLRLTYARKISSKQLVDTSLKEMARILDGEVDDFERLRDPLRSCFRDVRKGDVIDGVSHNLNSVTFYYNGNKSCALNIPDVSKEFFSIWLSDQSRSKKQTDRLLGRG